PKSKHVPLGTECNVLGDFQFQRTPSPTSTAVVPGTNENGALAGPTCTVAVIAASADSGASAPVARAPPGSISAPATSAISNPISNPITAFIVPILSRPRQHVMPAFAGIHLWHSMDSRLRGSHDV